MPDLHLEIDPLQLDQACLDQPVQYHTWAVARAEARAAVDSAKSELDISRAELDSMIRSDPAAYGLGKVTEESVKAAIIQQPLYVAAMKNLSKAKYEEDLADAAVNSLEHRKRSISLLTELWIRDYYSDPLRRREEDDEETKKRVRSRGRERRERENELD